MPLLLVIHHEVVRVVTERFEHLAHAEGILVCWACAIPVVLQIHARDEAHDHPAEGTPTDARADHPPRPHNRPTRACARIRPLHWISLHRTPRSAFGTARCVHCRTTSPGVQLGLPPCPMRAADTCAVRVERILNAVWSMCTQINCSLNGMEDREVHLRCFFRSMISSPAQGRSGTT